MAPGSTRTARSWSTPLIANDIERQAQEGTLIPGQRLPSEADLAAEYGVARMTVRRAMRELRERGLVRTVPGKGNYIRAAQLTSPPPSSSWPCFSCIRVRAPRLLLACLWALPPADPGQPRGPVPAPGR